MAARGDAARTGNIPSFTDSFPIRDVSHFPVHFDDLSSFILIIINKPRCESDLSDDNTATIVIFIWPMHAAITRTWWDIATVLEAAEIVQSAANAHHQHDSTRRDAKKTG